MAQEVIYETGKRKNRAAKAGKADEQPANQTAPDDNNVGWEEQLWMNQAESTTDATAAWQPTPHSMTGMSTNAPTLDTLKEQWGQVRRQVEQGWQSLLSGDQLNAAANRSLHSINDTLNDERSVEEIKRWSSLIGGGFLALVGLRRSLGSLALMTVGAGLVYYALTGRWLLQGANQQRGRAQMPHTGRTGSTSLDSNRPLTVKNIIVKAPLADTYQAWANFENFPNFMQHIRSVTKTGERTSHWVMDGPLHSRLEWNAETTRLDENSRIAWSSIDGDIKTSGQVTFNALTNDEVEVTVMLRYIPPAGIAGDLFATLFTDPEGKLEEDLRNFKHFIEQRDATTEGAGN